jgi:MoaA/NifB/PqqE/SkfB family radical SAM enzyme
LLHLCVSPSVRSIDVYVTFKCNLRCSHCFVGDNLQTNREFDWDLLTKLISQAPSWGAEEITFMGGEPTLFPRITEAMSLVAGAGMGVRIVTNGQSAFQRTLSGYPGTTHVCFSLDGSSAARHDSIRGAGSFDRLLDSVAAARDLGLSTSGIVSLDRSNRDDCTGILRLCEQLGFQYVNVHYVTNRGFATEASVLEIGEWLAVVEEVEAVSRTIDLDIRIERTFAPRGEFVGHCAVRQESNLMFFPDGRVFRCAMFIDRPGAHSFLWTNRGLTPNAADTAETALCKADSPVHCPAMQFVNTRIHASAVNSGYSIRCIYDKSFLRGGLEHADEHCKHL